MATQYAKRSFLMVVVSALLLFSLFTITYAASTIGTNMSTTGTFTLTVGSATAARFQNAAGTTTVLVVDTASTRVGVGTGSPTTTFEVQGTASASYFLTGNTIQVGGFASAAYSRFGTNTATASDIATTNDLLISGNLEVDLKSYFDSPTEVQGTASASYFLTGNTIQVGGFASVAYSRFGTTATSHVGTISTTTDLMVGGGFEVNGSAAFDGFTFFTGGASISATNFEITGNNRFGINAGATTQATLEVGGTASISGVASVSGNFAAGMASTGTSSFMFDTPSTTLGACMRIKDNDGAGYTYLRVSNGVGTFSTVDCR
ncbi:MAG: hypothetical protein Q7S43_01150 [bacterium]|nr:hypothetical protein [bacterium]